VKTVEIMRLSLVHVAVELEQPPMRKLTNEEFEQLCNKAEEVRPNAITSGTDEAVKQHVLSYFDSHWLFTYFRTVDDLCDDTWTCVISRIECMHVDIVTVDSPVCSNVIPAYVLDKEGNKLKVVIQDVGDYE